LIFLLLILTACSCILILLCFHHTNAPFDDHGEFGGSSEVLGRSARMLSTVAASAAHGNAAADQDLKIGMPPPRWMLAAIGEVSQE
jgi:hypothetical protein